MKTEVTLEELQDQFNKANKKRNAIRNKIDEYKFKNEFPENVKKYEGKYFKYQNGWDGERKWYIFIYVSKVNFDKWYKGFKCEGIAFQTDTEGKISIETNDITHLAAEGEQIPKTAFDRALKTMLAKFTEITTFNQSPLTNKKSKDNERI